jgi:hypothetical protein
MNRLRNQTTADAENDEMAQVNFLYSAKDSLTASTATMNPE